MASLLLPIIYLSFVSLGLPDSLLGSAWPVMQGELGVPMSYAGIISMIIAGGTIVSSLNTARLIRRFGTGVIAACSVGMTAAALFGFSVTDTFPVMCLWSVPYGLGAGAIDAALNNYVAIHYSSRHMSWLHACWGVGVSISPNVMGYCLSNQFGWHMGYRTISVLQIVLTVCLILAVPLWKKQTDSGEEDTVAALSFGQAVKIPGAVYIFVAFFGFCAFEATAGLWASSYLVGYRGVDAETASRFASLFYLGETAGRFANGFICDRFGDRSMIKAGTVLMILGSVMIFLPLGGDTVALIGLVVAGLGAAPVYPCIIHSTPDNFGKEKSQAMVSIQIACAYCGSTFMPPIFGFLAENVFSLGLYPVYLAVFAVLMLIMTECLNRTVKVSLQ